MLRELIRAKPSRVHIVNIHETIQQSTQAVLSLLIPSARSDAISSCLGRDVSKYVGQLHCPLEPLS